MHLPVAPIGLGFFNRYMKLRGTCGSSGWNWSGQSRVDLVKIHVDSSQKKINEMCIFNGREIWNIVHSGKIPCMDESSDPDSTRIPKAEAVLQSGRRSLGRRSLGMCSEGAVGLAF